MRRKNLPRYHSFCVNDTTQALTRPCCAVHLNAVGRGGLHSQWRIVLFCDFTVPAPKGYAVSSATRSHQPRALCEFSALCFFIIAFQHILAYFSGVVKGVGGKSIGMVEFFTASSVDAHTVLRTRSLSRYLLPLLGTRQEVAKKRARTFPPGTPALPLCKENQERSHMRC